MLGNILRSLVPIIISVIIIYDIRQNNYKEKNRLYLLLELLIFLGMVFSFVHLCLGLLKIEGASSLTYYVDFYTISSLVIYLILTKFRFKKEG